MRAQIFFSLEMSRQSAESNSRDSKARFLDEREPYTVRMSKGHADGG